MSKKAYSIDCLKTLGDIVIYYQERPIGHRCATPREEVEHTMFSKEIINIFDVLKEKDSYERALLKIKECIKSKPYCTNGDIILNKTTLLKIVNKALEGNNESSKSK